MSFLLLTASRRSAAFGFRSMPSMPSIGQRHRAATLITTSSLLSDSCFHTTKSSAPQSTIRLSSTLSETETTMESEVGGEPLQAAEEIQPEIVAIDELDLENPAHLSTMNPYFKKMDLSQDIIDVLSRKGISSFTPVQAEAFEPIYLSRDVLCR